MDPLQSRIGLEADLDRIAGVIQMERWIIELWDEHHAGFFVTMASEIDGESYMLRLECSGYPLQPPSIRCVNPQTKDWNDPKAWPQCDHFRPPPSADLCLNISREGLTREHPAWQNDPRMAWDSTGNPILRVLHAIQDRLNDKGKYHGRNR